MPDQQTLHKWPTVLKIQICDTAINSHHIVKQASSYAFLPSRQQVADTFSAHLISFTINYYPTSILLTPQGGHHHDASRSTPTLYAVLPCKNFCMERLKEIISSLKASLGLQC